MINHSAADNTITYLNRNKGSQGKKKTFVQASELSIECSWLPAA